MASVEEKRVNGKIFSYYFSCTLGRDSQGKQIRRYKTWKYDVRAVGVIRLFRIASKSGGYPNRPK